MQTKRFSITLLLLMAMLSAGCGSNLKVGELRTESHSVELDGVKSVRVEVKVGAAALTISDGSDKLLESDFTYNVDKLKPDVTYKNGVLIIRHPDVKGTPSLQGITGYRNEWSLRLSDKVPMDLSVDMGAGVSDLQLAGLLLTSLNVTLGAGDSTIDLSGDWVHDVDVSINTGAANTTLKLPANVGVHIEIQPGPNMIETMGLTKDGSVYTNAAYGVSEATIRINMEPGIGQINLEEVADMHAQEKAALHTLLDKEVEKQDILGMVMAVRLADGTVIWGTSGYVDPSGNELWSANTPSLIGSITKTFTAVVVMQLVEEGKLSLDDTVKTWFPEQPNGDKITVRMLLSHTSGLADYQKLFELDPEKFTREWTPEELIAVANQAGPVGEPGSSIAHYSSTNYIMLGRIIEKVAGNNWEHEIESRIIQPLDLKDTTCATDDIKKAVAVPVYLKTSDGYMNLLEDPFYSQVSASVGWAAGGIASSASDLMTFASALFDGRFVSKETLELMSQPVGIEGGRAWGFGGGSITVGGHKAFAMGGDSVGYHAFFIGTLDGRFIVTALVNTDEGGVESPSMDALKSMLQQNESK